MNFFNWQALWKSILWNSNILCYFCLPSCVLRQLCIRKQRIILEKLKKRFQRNLYWVTIFARVCKPDCQECLWGQFLDRKFKMHKKWNNIQIYEIILVLNCLIVFSNINSKYNTSIGCMKKCAKYFRLWSLSVIFF